MGFALDARNHAKLCDWLKAPVELISSPLQDAEVGRETLDVVLSVSAIEHFSPEDLTGVADRSR